jgi:hypothetical protein
MNDKQHAMADVEKAEGLGFGQVDPKYKAWLQTK